MNNPTRTFAGSWHHRVRTLVVYIENNSTLGGRLKRSQNWQGSYQGLKMIVCRKNRATAALTPSVSATCVTSLYLSESEWAWSSENTWP